MKLQFIGRRDWRVPKRILRRIDETLELTGDNTAMTVSMAFNYGGRAELVDAVRAIAAEGIRRTRSTRRPSGSTSTTPTMPDPELMVRTSGEYRMSNFLMWEMAYSELVFTDVLWPDFRRARPVRRHRRVPASGPPLRRPVRRRPLHRLSGRRPLPSRPVAVSSG